MMASLLVLLVLLQIPLFITSQCTNFQYIVQPPTELPCNPFNGNKWKLRTICTVQTLSGSQSYEIHWFQRDKNGVVTDLGRPEFFTSGDHRKEVYYGLHLNDKDFTESMLGTYWCQVIDTSQQPNLYLGTSNNFTILRPNEYDNGLSACIHTTTVSTSETKCADDPPPPMISITLPLPTTLSTLISTISPPLPSSIATGSSMSLLFTIGSSLYLPTSSTMVSPQLSSMFIAITLSSSSSPIISSLISKTTILSISSSHFSIQSNSLVSSSESHATSTSDNAAFVVITTTSIIQHKTAVVHSTSIVTSITPTQSVTHSPIQIIESPSQGEQQPEPQPFLIYIVMIVITASVVVIIVVISLVILLIILVKKPKLRDLSLTKEPPPVNLTKDRDSMYTNPTYNAVNVITTIQDSDKNSYQPLITRGLDYANVYTSIKGRNTTNQNEERKTYVNVDSNII